MRKCVTLTCRDRLKKGTNAEIWRECVEYCRNSRRAGIGEPVRCAEKTGVICIRDWYGEACVDARERCETGRFLPDGGC